MKKVFIVLMFLLVACDGSDYERQKKLNDMLLNDFNNLEVLKNKILKDEENFFADYLNFNTNFKYNIFEASQIEIKLTNKASLTEYYGLNFKISCLNEQGTVIKEWEEALNISIRPKSIINTHIDFKYQSDEIKSFKVKLLSAKSRIPDIIG
jgi:hypothetical protein